MEVVDAVPVRVATGLAVVLEDDDTVLVARVEAEVEAEPVDVAVVVGELMVHVPPGLFAQKPEAHAASVLQLAPTMASCSARGGAAWHADRNASATRSLSARIAEAQRAGKRARGWMRQRIFSGASAQI